MHSSSQLSVECSSTTTATPLTATTPTNSSFKRPGVFKRRQTIATLPPTTAAAATNAATAVSKSVNSSSSDLTPAATISGLQAPEDAQRSRGSLRHQQRVRSPTTILGDSETVAPTGGGGTLRGGSGRRLQGRYSGGDVVQQSAHQSSTSLMTAGHSGNVAGQQQQQQQQGHRRLGRTPSSPSVLFSRVKERIREKVFETSAEWPHMAAVERERRQRAAQAFEQSLQRSSMTRSSNSKSSRQGRQTVARQPSVSAADDVMLTSSTSADKPGEKRRVRIKSDPSRRTVTSSSSNDSRETSVDATGLVVPSTSSSLPAAAAARLAFRRRSISEDTYILESQQLLRLSAAAAAANIDSGRLLDPDSKEKRQSGSDGVVCSNEDLKAIVHQHKLRRSPVVSPSTIVAPSLTSHTATVRQLSVSDDVIVHVSSRPPLYPVDSEDAVESPTSPGVAVAADWIVTSAFSPPPAPLVTLTSVGSASADASLPKFAAVETGSPANVVQLADKPVECQCPVVKDVVYDEHGQTWDVYGADFDPEILGQAIQAYLEKIINKKVEKAAAGATAIASAAQQAAAHSQELFGSRDSCLCESSTIARNHSRRQLDRAIRFVMRFLCTPVWRQHQQHRQQQQQQTRSAKI